MYRTNLITYRRKVPEKLPEFSCESCNLCQNNNCYLYKKRVSIENKCWNHTIYLNKWRNLIHQNKAVMN